MKIQTEQIFNDGIFEILYPNDISNLGNLIIDIKEGERLDLSNKPELEGIERSEWEERTLEAQNNGRVLVAGPQFRLSSYTGNGSNITLYLAPSNYRELIGTNGLAFSKPEVFAKFLNEGRMEGNVSKYLSNVLAVCAAILKLSCL